MRVFLKQVRSQKSGEHILNGQMSESTMSFEGCEEIDFNLYLDPFGSRGFTHCTQNTGFVFVCLGIKSSPRLINKKKA